MLATTDPIDDYGEFVDRELESTYRSAHLVSDRRTASACILVCLIGCAAFVGSDYLLFGRSPQFFVLLATRAGVLVLSLLVWRLFRQPLTTSEYDHTAFYWCLLAITQILYITSTRPPTYTGHVVVNLSAILLIYTVLPLPLKRQTILAGILSIGCVALAAGDGLSAAAYGWSFLGVNVLGAFFSRRQHRLGREMFAARLQLEASLAEVRTLRGLIRVCAWCKKVAVEDQWEELEAYVQEHTHAEFTHGICPHCYSIQEDKIGQT